MYKAQEKNISDIKNLIDKYQAEVVAKMNETEERARLDRQVITYIDNNSYYIHNIYSILYAFLSFKNHLK